MKYIKPFNSIRESIITIHDQDSYSNWAFRKTNNRFDDFNLYDDINSDSLKELEIDPNNLSNDDINLIKNDKMVKIIKWVHVDDNIDSMVKSKIDNILNSNKSVLYRIGLYSFLRIDYCK